MHSDSLDVVDKGILHLLQEDARGNSNVEIAERVGLAASTIGTRINRLEADGIIAGYHPAIDYDAAGYDDHVLVVGTVPFDDRGPLVERIATVCGVVSVRELLTNRENVSVEVVGRSRHDLEGSLAELNETGLDVERIEMMKREIVHPFDHFGEGIADE